MTWVLIILLTWCFFLIAIIIGWNRAKKLGDATVIPAEQMVTVIIPVRNDASTIEALLQSLRAQDLQPREVIIVDDHSEDDLAVKLNSLSLSNARLLTNEGSGKKHAITTGVKNSKGAIIVTTDADCVAPPGWIRTLTSAFSNEDVSFVFGPVAIDGDRSFFASLQAMEFASLIGSGAATAALGMPTMCNGANLAYRKTMFEAVGGYNGTFDIASGDDEHLMRKIQSIKGKVRFVGDQQAIITTRSVRGFSPFVMQRLRWASKWKRNSDWFSKLLALYLLICQLALVAAVIGAIAFANMPILSLLLAKVALEGVFIYQVCRFLDVSRSFIGFLILQIAYPLYVVAIGLTSLFYTPSWKGRKGLVPDAGFV